MPRLLDRLDSPADLKRLEVRDLPRLCRELRADIVDVGGRSGGHVAASLGAVELAVCLHRVFDSPRDRILWDAGDQAYAHKLLTGRRDRFSSLRAEGGLSSFPDRQESEHDPFGVGHASTAISAALGMVEARRLGGGAHRIVAVVSDAALAGGEALEALNLAGAQQQDLAVVLNDDGGAAAAGAGALARWRSREDGSLSTVFEALGFRYVGPVDGHDVAKLIKALRKAARARGPVLLHVTTTRGKGLTAGDADGRGHARPGVEARVSEPRPKPAAPPLTEVFVQALCDEMQRDPRIVAVSAGPVAGAGLAAARRLFADRTYRPGLAEQHAVTFAAGLAADGLRPVVSISSTFLQRAYDQVVHDVAIQRLPVTLALDGGGLVGGDGKTHQGALDLSYLRCVPELTVMAPADENELRLALATALRLDGPVALRFPRGEGVGVALDPAAGPLAPGRGRILRDGGPEPEVPTLAAGAPAHAAAEAAAQLAAEGIRATVVDARFVKPLDRALVVAVASGTRRLVTVEESALAGGFGSAVLECLAEEGLSGVRVRRLGLPDRFVPHGDPAAQRAALGLDAAGIARTCRELVGFRSVVTERVA